MAMDGIAVTIDLGRVKNDRTGIFHLIPSDGITRFYIRGRGLRLAYSAFVGGADMSRHLLWLCKRSSPWLLYTRIIIEALAGVIDLTPGRSLEHKVLVYVWHEYPRWYIDEC